MKSLEQQIHEQQFNQTVNLVLSYISVLNGFSERVYVQIRDELYDNLASQLLNQFRHHVVDQILLRSVDM